MSFIILNTCKTGIVERENGCLATVIKKNIGSNDSTPHKKILEPFATFWFYFCDVG